MNPEEPGTGGLLKPPDGSPHDYLCRPFSLVKLYGTSDLKIIIIHIKSLVKPKTGI
jgi:hypothetical protein